LESDTVLIALSTKKIKEDSEDKYCFSHPIKSLFYTFLHEFHHLLALIDLYLKRDKGANLEMIAEQQNNELLKECRRLRGQEIDSDESWFNTPKEQEWDYLAFQDLTSFENLYEHDFLYTPLKAFMAKVRQSKEDKQIKDTKIPNNKNIIEMVQPAQSR
jgi:hypothetical protein